MKPSESRPLRAVAARSSRHALGICTVLAILAGLAATAGAAGQVEDRQARFGMSLDQGRLSLDVDEVPLVEVLTALADEAGFEIELRGAIEDRISQSIVDRPLHLAIGEMLGQGRYSFFLEFANPEADSTDASPAQQVARLVVISRPDTASTTREASPVDALPDPGPRETDTDGGPAEADEEAAMEEALDILDRLLREEQEPLIREAAAEALEDLQNGPQGQ